MISVNNTNINYSIHFQTKLCITGKLITTKRTIRDKFKIPRHLPKQKPGVGRTGTG